MLNTKVVVGDVFQSMKTLKNNSVHVVITSPPYFGLRHYVHGETKKKEIGQEDCIESYLGVMTRFLGECWRVLRPDGSLYVVLGDTYTDDTKFPKDPRKFSSNRVTGLPRRSALGMPWRIAIAAMNTGWTIRSEIIVFNPTASPSGNTDRPATAHQTMFLMAKSDSYFYDGIASAEPSSGKCRLRNVTEAAKSKEENLIRGNARLHASMRMTTDIRRLRSVWTVPINKSPKDLPPKTTHHARFTLNLPVKILTAAVSEHGYCGRCQAPYQRVIKKVKRKIEGHLTLCYETKDWEKTCKCLNRERVRPIVLDPFCGSGTTLVAALRANCHAVGFELSPYFAQEAREWLQQEKRRLPRNLSSS